MFICLSSLMTSNQNSKFNKVLKDNKDACEYRINQRHHCKPNIFFLLNFLIFFLFNYKWFLNYSIRSNMKFITQSNKQSILPPNLKLTLSSMFKKIYVRIKDKSWNERTREMERKHLIWWWTPQAISCKMVRYSKQNKRKLIYTTDVKFQRGSN